MTFSEELLARPRARPGFATWTRRSHWIDEWRPEDRDFWETSGAVIARRNLVFSIFSEHIGFSVWSMWSVLVLFLGPEYGFDPGQKFLLVSIPAAVGGVLRVPYTLAVAKFGGRNWTIVSALALLAPCFAALFVLRPGVSFTNLMLAAAIAGVGGANFSSAMANIDAFYPQRLKGFALGLNAGGGNLGVAVVQLVGLAVLAIAGANHPRVLVAVYLPLVVVSAACSALFMDNLTMATNENRALRDVCRVPDSWLLSFLYIGTFGSFIGFGFAFGQVLLVQFPGTFETAIRAASLTFIGPLLGSLVRPVGGALADRFGGAVITCWNFGAMFGAATVVLLASARTSLPLFLVGFIALFVFSGLGNGSTYKMIPTVFGARAADQVAAGGDAEVAHRNALGLSRGLIGIAGAVGAFGGLLVNVAFRQAFLTSSTGTVAYVAFAAFYAACAFVTWFVYIRPRTRRLVGV